MSEYITRLIKCGYTEDRAVNTYYDFMRNFTIADLDIYVKQAEKNSNVDVLQS